jgi:phosphatidylserine/phosphatidylglycerophosphate/cardiolipin synthase-like enzyme
MRRQLAMVGGVCAAVLGLTAVLLTLPARADTTVVTEAVFNDPTVVGGGTAIQNKIVSMIEGTPAGERIRMSIFYADDPTIPNALAAAHARGVNVQVIFDHRETGLAPWSTLAAALGTDPAASSWLMACPANKGCIGTRTLGSVNALNHNKFYLFSSTGGSTDVVVQSSANLHDGRDGLKGWNNALILVGNASIWNDYNAYFEDLKAQQSNINYYDTRVPVQSGSAKVFHYPRKETSGASAYEDPAEDTIYTILSHVDCFGNSVVGTQDGTHRTIIRVAMDIFSRDYLATKLWDLDNAGCYVEVAETYDMSSALQVTSMKNLLKATSSAYHGPVVRYYCSGDTIWIHSKYMQIEGQYYGTPDRKIVWTGSHNWSTNSLRQADETILQLENGPVYDAYTANFRSIRDSSTIRTVANGGAASC